MDALTTAAIAIAAFVLLIVLTAMELKTASFMHAEKKSSSPAHNTDKNECNTDEKECNCREDENDDKSDDVTQD